MGKIDRELFKRSVWVVYYTEPFSWYPQVICMKFTEAEAKKKAKKGEWVVRYDLSKAFEMNGLVELELTEAKGGNATSLPPAGTN